MAKMIKKGSNGALLEVCNNDTKYELVSAWGYNEADDTWCQGHYFTLWYGEITEANKAKLFEKAMKHFTENYL